MGGKVINYPTKILCNQAKEEGWQEGHREGEQLGRMEGRCIEMSNIIEIIRKKLIKKMSIEDITELLEMDFQYISHVANLIKENPQKSDLEIAKMICEEHR